MRRELGDALSGSTPPPLPWGDWSGERRADTLGPATPAVDDGTGDVTAGSHEDDGGSGAGWLPPNLRGA